MFPVVKLKNKNEKFKKIDSRLRGNDKNYPYNLTILYKHYFFKKKGLPRATLLKRS